MPFSHGSPGYAEIVSQLSEAPSSSTDDGKRTHSQRLRQVSGHSKSKMLTQGKALMVQGRRMQIGQKIKMARIGAALSQRDLATQIGITHGLVGAWESHKKAPGRATLIKLARVTGQPLSFFIDNMKPDAAVLETRFPDEIELIKLFRRISEDQQRTHLELLRQSVRVRAVKEP